jgi:hypothetical protein
MNRRSFFQAALTGLLVLGGVAAPNNTVQAQKKKGKGNKAKSKAGKKKSRSRRHGRLSLLLRW